MSPQSFPFDDKQDINLSEDVSLIEDQDLEFPVSPKSGHVSRTFLYVGGFMILAALLGMTAIVILLLSASSEPVPPMVATLPIATTRAIETAIAATQTRSVIVNMDTTETETAHASDTASAMANLMNESRTAIGGSTSNFAYRETQVGAYRQNQTVSARPRVLQAQILDFNGNSVTGITIQIYQDNGDGVFNSPSPTFTKAG